MEKQNKTKLKSSIYSEICQEVKTNNLIKNTVLSHTPCSFISQTVGKQSLNINFECIEDNALQM